MQRPPRLELYGTPSCPYTADLRDHLTWQGEAFVEYDVERDAAAWERLQRLTGNGRTVPVLVEDGAVKAVGWRGRGCTVGPPRRASEDER